MQYCKKCGAENPNEAKFCRECGGEFRSISNQEIISASQPDTTTVKPTPLTYTKEKKGVGKIVFFSALVTGLLIAIFQLTKESNSSNYDSEVFIPESYQTPSEDVAEATEVTETEEIDITDKYVDNMIQNIKKDVWHHYELDDDNIDNWTCIYIDFISGGDCRVIFKDSEGNRDEYKGEYWIEHNNDTYYLTLHANNHILFNNAKFKYIDNGGDKDILKVWNDKDAMWINFKK